MMMMMLCKKIVSSSFKDFSRRWCTSALYITGDKAKKTFAVLTPIVDFDEQLQNLDVLKKNVVKRGLEIDIDEIEKRWKFFQSISNRKQSLESTRSEIGQAVAGLLKNAEGKQEEIERLKLHARVVKDDLKHLKEAFYEIEEETMLKVLNLPNRIHEKTPEKETVLYCSPDSGIFGEVSKSHIDIAESKKYVHYINPLACYFKSDASLFEIGILNYLRQYFLKSGYVQFSNPNFCRSVVVEGCGANLVENSKLFTLEEEDSENIINRLHLCGSASVYLFMAYFTKHAIQETMLPLKYFSLGKRYMTVKTDLPVSFFNLGQQAVSNFFIASCEDEEILDSLVEEVSAFYESLGYHFRMTLLPAHQLKKSESLRLSIQMYSNHIQSYVEVGNISLHESYFSKRLLFTYNSNKIRKYPKVVSGTLLNVPKVLGCVLENNVVKNVPLLSDLLKHHMFM